MKQLRMIFMVTRRRFILGGMIGLVGSLFFKRTGLGQLPKEYLKTSQGFHPESWDVLVPDNSVVSFVRYKGKRYGLGWKITGDVVKDERALEELKRATAFRLDQIAGR